MTVVELVSNFRIEGLCTTLGRFVVKSKEKKLLEVITVIVVLLNFGSLHAYF